jgi:hypothetical protein
MIKTKTKLKLNTISETKTKKNQNENYTCRDSLLNQSRIRPSTSTVSDFWLFGLWNAVTSSQVAFDMTISVDIFLVTSAILMIVCFNYCQQNILSSYAPT